MHREDYALLDLCTVRFRWPAGAKMTGLKTKRGALRRAEPYIIWSK